MFDDFRAPQVTTPPVGFPDASKSATSAQSWRRSRSQRLMTKHRRSSEGNDGVDLTRKLSKYGTSAEDHQDHWEVSQVSATERED